MGAQIGIPEHQVGVHHRQVHQGHELLLALLVAQSRVEAGIHSTVEVVAGAVLGAGVTLLLFQVWG